MKEIPLTQGKVAIVDDEDYAEVSKYKWCASRSGGRFYVQGCVNGRKTAIHRFLLKTPKGMHTDHINGDGLDNRRSNIRVCTPAQNCANSKLSENNKSGYKGATWCNSSFSWESSITHEGKYVKLGRFKNRIEAAIAYDMAAYKLFGKFARYNFPDNAIPEIPKTDIPYEGMALVETLKSRAANSSFAHRFITTQELSVATGISECTIYGMVDFNVIPAVRVGSAVRINVERFT